GQDEKVGPSGPMGPSGPVGARNALSRANFNLKVGHRPVPTSPLPHQPDDRSDYGAPGRSVRSDGSVRSGSGQERPTAAQLQFERCAHHGATPPLPPQPAARDGEGGKG